MKDIVVSDVQKCLVFKDLFYVYMYVQLMKIGVRWRLDNTPSNSFNLCTPTEAVKSKIPKPNTPVMQAKEKEEEKSSEMREINDMFKTVIMKLEKLDKIEADVNDIKKSLEYAHAEIQDLKKENKIMKKEQAKAEERIEKLEVDKNTLRDKIID